MADELVDIVDEQGRVLRQALKTKAHVHGSLSDICVVAIVGGWCAKPRTARTPGSWWRRWADT
ncbi:MAG TPA: hypothetical protein VJP80_06985 [Candidatus Saccharimonadales bacterium]|nr:hypothetical protein [Candidatus Saccharimonadales bacterium]